MASYDYEYLGISWINTLNYLCEESAIMNYLDFVMESKLLGRKLPPPFPQLASYSSVRMVAKHGVASLFQVLN